MNYYRISIGLVLVLLFGTPATASDLQQGIHGMKWGSSISEYDELTYRDQLFAVFIKLRSPDQFSQLERQFTIKHGKPKTTYYPKTRQTVHRWKDADVKIKLKMKESTREFKLAIYYAPLATTVKSAPLLDE